MNWKSKYIIVDHDGVTIPIVFSELAQHSEVARAFYGRTVIGAGFCYLQGTEGNEAMKFVTPAVYVCYGESISLKVKSRPQEDAEIINRYLGISEKY